MRAIKAEQLLVNPNTIARAYRELETAGIVEKRRTAGTYVSDQGSPLARRERLKILTDRIDALVAEALQAPLTAQFRMELRPASVSVVTFFTPPDGEPAPDPTCYLAAPARTEPTSLENVALEALAQALRSTGGNVSVDGGASSGSTGGSVLISSGTGVVRSGKVVVTSPTSATGSSGDIDVSSGASNATRRAQALQHQDLR